MDRPMTPQEQRIMDGALRRSVTEITDPREAEILRLRAALTDARNNALEEAATECEKQSAAFLTPEYSTGQPLASFQERFACKSCAEAIRAMKEKGE